MNAHSLQRDWRDYIRTRDPQIKNRLIVHYLPLVKATAERVAGTLPGHIQIDDLISAGVFGLLSSIEKFDPNAGHQFRSFASFRIHGAMLDELRSMDWVPRSIRAKSRKLQAAFSAVQQQKGRFATESEVAEFLGISIEELESIVDETRILTLISLDSRIYHSRLDSPVSFSEIIPDRSRPSPPQQISRKEEKRILLEAIQNLSRQEKIVLTLYYFEEFTLREIGEVLGVSESRICQIHSKAIYRLRARLSMSEVTDYAPH